MDDVRESLKLSLNSSKEQMGARRKVETRRALKTLRKRWLTGQGILTDMRSEGKQPYCKSQGCKDREETQKNR